MSVCQVQNLGQKIHRRSLQTINAQSIWICFRFVKWVSSIYIPCIAVSDFTGERPHVLLKLCKKNITILISSIRLNTFSCFMSTFFPEKKKQHQQSRPTVSLVVSTLNMQHNHRIHECMTYFQEISNRTHWTDPEKNLEYLIARSQLTKRDIGTGKVPFKFGRNYFTYFLHPSMVTAGKHPSPMDPIGTAPTPTENPHAPKVWKSCWRRSWR